MALETRKDTSDNDSKHPAIVRDPDFWYSDGSVVVVAQGVAFRVHKSLLAQQSNAFRDLFMVPTPPMPDPADVMDGCPVVCLTDTSHDFRELLRVIYCGPMRFLSGADPGASPKIPFSVLAALARLGHKYEIECVLDGAMIRLVRIFTASANPPGDGLPPSGASYSAALGTGIVGLQDVNVIEALHLARLLDEPGILSVMLFLCAQLPVPVLLRGTQRADGTPERLCTEDIERLLIARERLAMLDVPPFLRMSEPPPDPGWCKMPAGKCTLEWQKMKERYVERYISTPAWRGNPFRLQAHELEWPQGRPCDGCIRCLEDCLKRHHESVWEKLPEIFRISVKDWKA